MHHYCALCPLPHFTSVFGFGFVFCCFRFLGFGFGFLRQGFSVYTWLALNSRELPKCWDQRHVSLSLLVLFSEMVSHCNTGRPWT